MAEEGRNQFGWRREEAQVVKLPRERLKGFEVWGNLERRRNVHGSEYPVPMGSG